MSEVQRYKVAYASDMNESEHGNWVNASDYDEAQEELSALREENERLKSESFEELYNAAIDERDALRGEVANSESVAKSEIEGLSLALQASQQRLTAAEQRNARLESLLHRSYGAVRACDYDDLESDIDEVLKPTESGASE